MTDNAPISTSTNDTQSESNIPSNPSASPSTQPASILPSTTISTETKSASATSDSIPPASTDLKNIPEPEPEPESKPNSNTNPSSKGKAKPKGLTKGKGKKAKARPRRRVAGSDADSDLGNQHSGDESLTDPSSFDSESESEEEDDVEEEGEGEGKKGGGKSGKKKPVFEDTNATTPAAWNDKDQQDSNGVEVSFDEFNRGEIPSKVKGKEKAKAKNDTTGTTAPAPKREYTEEENKRFQEMKAKRKEKQKAKRAEIKENKRKERNSTSNKPVIDESKPADDVSKKISIKGKGKKKDTSEVDQVIASTSSMTLEENTVPLVADGSPPPPVAATPALAKGRRDSKSQASRDKNMNDPKVVPKVGKFWTHDQRADPPIVSDGFAGRGLPDGRGRGMPRGGFRGNPAGFRGRGGRGGFVPPQFGRFPQQILQGQGKELTTETKSNAEKENDDGEEPVLAMDRLEKELAAEKEKLPQSSSSVQPKEKMWGHEAYEQSQIQVERKFVPPVLSRGGFRGVPRGRARGFGPRGGFFGQPFRPPFHRPPFASPAAPAVVSSTPTSENVVPSTPAVKTIASQTAASAELQSTQPDVDDLLGESTQAVTIKLPGSSDSVEVTVVVPPLEPKSLSNDVVSAPSTEVSVPAIKTPELNASGQAILYTSPVPPPPVPQQPQARPAPAAYVNASSTHSPMFPHITTSSPFPAGSENGSISSAGLSYSHFVPAHLQQPTSGYVIGTEFVPSAARPFSQMNNGQPKPFYPGGQGQVMAPRSYPIQNQHQHQHQLQTLQTQTNQRPYYPQQQSFEYQPQSQRGSFSGPQQFYPQQANGYVDGRGSPFDGSPGPSPYGVGAGAGQMNYFAPARPSQKISIKQPSNSDSSQQPEHEISYNGQQPQQPQFASLTASSTSQQGYYDPQHYNPYTTHSQNQSHNHNQLDQSYYNGNVYNDPNGLVGYNHWDGQNGYSYEGDYGY
ncbi:uncharacterized protein IL334_000079 [Kwoniella shivajii]|uniref:Btz domain-containing protein n=1 Tax=Kwoniella shivajii TaxID=564305 RepID=A0ABZ1CN46_9TREE|nr:hypothetical protein IL334_000079 [Kwoniella shivajii]